MPSWVPFKKWRESLLDGTAEGLGANPGLYMAALTANANLETASAFSTWSEVSSFSPTGVSGWTNDGEAIANETVTLTTANGTVASDFDDVTFTSAAGGPTNVRYFVVRTSADALVAWASAGSDKSVQSGDLTVQLDADGFLVST